MVEKGWNLESCLLHARHDSRPLPYARRVDNLAAKQDERERPEQRMEEKSRER